MDIQLAHDEKYAQFREKFTKIPKEKYKETLQVEVVLIFLPLDIILLPVTLYLDDNLPCDSLLNNNHHVCVQNIVSYD